MNTQGLNLDNAPPLATPFLFFNTAPWMGVIAAFVVFFSDQIFVSQWTSGLLAVTHLFTLGFMTMIMLGALFQVLPVISGESIPGRAWVAPVVHLSLLVGSLVLVAGFALSQYWLFSYGIPILLFGFTTFLISLALVLARRISGGHSINAIRLATVSLMLTITFGVIKAINYVTPDVAIDVINGGIFHIVWGLAGWLSLLIMGVSFQVIPMFHVTPNFPLMVTKYIPFAVFFSLMLLITPLQPLFIVLLCCAVLIYAISALKLLTKRRRKITDVTVNFWRLALINLSLVVVLVFIRYFDQVGEVNLLTDYWQKINIALGALMVVGFASSVIIGMLQKIVPFLVFMHLQKQCGTDLVKFNKVPTMRTIVPEKQSRIQFYLHLCAIVLLVLALMMPVFKFFLAIVMACNFGWLGYSLIKASKLYYQLSKALA